MRARVEAGKKSKIFVDIINGSPLLNCEMSIYAQNLCSSDEEVAFIVPPDAIYLREREILPTSRYHRTIFIWVADSSISDVIRILDDSILWCEQVGIRASNMLNLSQIFLFGSNLTRVDSFIWPINKLTTDKWVRKIDLILNNDSTLSDNFTITRKWRNSIRDGLGWDLDFILTCIMLYF